MSKPPITWQETAQRLRQDRERLLAHIAAEDRPRPLLLCLHPPYLCARLHRTSHWFFRRGRGRIARFFWHLNVLLTGVDIHPHCDLGGGLLIPHPPAVSLSGRAGRNLMALPLSGIGGQLGRREDVGAGPGLPVLGDDVTLQPHSGVLGPVTIGDGASIGAGCIVTHDLPAGAATEPAPVRIVRKHGQPHVP